MKAQSLEALPLVALVLSFCGVWSLRLVQQVEVLLYVFTWLISQHQ